MPKFFQNAPAVWHNTTVLSQRITPMNSLAYTHNAADQQIIASCTQDVQRQLANIQAIDKKIVLGFAIGTSAFLLSWLLPLTSIAIAGIAYGTYQLGLRQQAFSEYKQALENLANCCAWSLGNVQNPQIVNEKVIQDMITTLGPLTNDQNLRDFIDNGHEDHIIAQVNKMKSDMEIDGHKLNQKEAQVYYHTYGYNQGGVAGIIKTVALAIKLAVENFRGKKEEPVEVVASVANAL